MNSLSNDPTETAAVLHGILAGPIAPTVDQRAAMDVPALVIGHRVDRIHPFHDAEQLARRLPNGRLVQASSILELRMHPERLTDRDRQLPRRRVGEPPAEERAARSADRTDRTCRSCRLVAGSASVVGVRLAGCACARSAGACPPVVAPWPPGTGRVGRRGLSTCRASATRARKRSTASCRLRTWDRSSSATTRTSGPSRSSSRARCRGPRVGDPATSKRSSTRVLTLLACWPPGPPLGLNRNWSSDRGMRSEGVTRTAPPRRRPCRSRSPRPSRAARRPPDWSARRHPRRHGHRVPGGQAIGAGPPRRPPRPGYRS